jgi:hypothetical protein
MTQIWIAEEVEKYFAASPIGPLLELSHVARDDDHHISRAVKESLAQIPSEMVTQIIIDTKFHSLYGHLGQTEQESFAREWAIIEELNGRIRRHRMAHLISRRNLDHRPAPYDEPALADVVMSEDELVPLSQFKVEEGVLVRNGRAYTDLPQTPSENSSYWITRALITGGLQDRAWVRLDPLLFGPANEFPRMSHRMLWWGPPLLWKDVATIEHEQFGRWAPASLGSRSEFTDFAWVPRGEELHLLLEEMPKRNDLEVSGSRYFHAIFCKKSQRVIHLDGAIRIYSTAEWDLRKNIHVHRTGKVGRRIKVFRLDGPIQPEVVSNLGGTYFVWNFDVANFFDAPVPALLLGSDG